jgi:HEAT repeat protein/energy-coupling factor transporter ATP-binding protein EcfA2
LGEFAQTTLIFSKNIAMGKYRKDKITLGNALKVVEALLILADEEITVPGDKLKATFKLEWVKEDELQVSGTVEQKRKNKIQPVEKGITKDDLWTLVECIGETLELSPSKDGMKRDSPEKRKQAVQDVLDCLTDLKLLEDKRPHGKNDKSGYWKFHLKLKHQTADKKDNLKVIKEKWDDNIGSFPDLELATTTKNPIDWREICQRNLAQQKELTTNPFTNANGISPKLDKVYVPLAIVERKPSKPKSNKQPEETEKETLIPIEEKRFFEEVLRQGKSEISQGRKIAIIGEPGSGKTTRLQKIADWILDQDLGLPIWVSLADLTQGTVYKYIEELWLAGENLTLDALKPEKNRIWLLLDGLDEMTSKIESRHVSALLGGWLQDARVVVTCRVNVWEADQNAFSGFDVFRNLEFSREQINQYIGNWFTEIGDAATGESLDKELAKSENLAFNQLIQNPLRLWMLCQIWQTGGGLPDTQAELYRQFVDRVYRWKADEEILDQRSEIDTALARLALAAMEQKKEVSRFQLSESWIVKVLGRRKIFEAVKKLGWLNRIERFPEAIYVFYHATFQEYFAALAVDDSVDYWDYFLPRNHVDRPVEGKEYRIFQPQWKQVILFWLGRGDVEDKEKFNKEKEEFIEALVNFKDGCGEWNIEEDDRGFYEYRAYFLAAAGIAELGKEYSKAREIVNKIVKWSFGYFNTECQEQQMNFPRPLTEAAQAILRETHRSIVVETLIDWLTSPNEYTCIGVAHSLGEIAPGHSQAIDTLMNLIHQSSIPGIRIQAVMALEKVIKNNQEKIDLLTSLCNNSDPAVSSIAAQCLGKIDPNYPKAELLSVSFIIQSNSFQESVKSGKVDPRNPEVIQSLINEVRFSDNNNRQLNAVKNLGYTYPRDPDAIIKLLIDLINNHHTDHKIRHEAIRSLGRISKNSCDGINFLINVIVNSHYNLKIIQAAVGALQYIEISYQEVINALLNLICTISEHSIRLGATRTLQKILQRHLSELTILALKNCLPVNINSKQDLDIYLCCYEVLWQCAENLPYPQFYHAWHGLTAISPFVQTLELAQLPQNLETQLTKTNLNQTLQIFYIDGSKFIGDDPAKTIYRQMTQQGSQKIDEKPKNMTDLQDYWADLIEENDKPPVLIFYENPSNRTPQGFRPEFLDILTRFDGIICLITDQTHPPLQTFSPQDPQLIDNIMAWLKRTILEM